MASPHMCLAATSTSLPTYTNCCSLGKSNWHFTVSGKTSWSTIHVNSSLSDGLNLIFIQFSINFLIIIITIEVPYLQLFLILFPK